MAKTADEIVFNVQGDDNVKPNIQDAVKLETTVLENKYLRWIVSIGVAFLILKTVDTAQDLRFMQGKQEYLDKTIENIYSERNEVINSLKDENVKLKNELLDKERLKIELERAKLELERLSSTKKK
ncbi:MAG: hypothetical protein JNL17_12000 [Cyclobacteriaceae bacterium]|nr:hypothetical protein [Cyclobacteriaceae bacterium]